MAIHTQTFTAEIENITPISSGVWRIVLKDSEAILTGVNPPSTQLGSDISDENNVLLNPFINVYNIDYHPYNAVINNASTISNKSFLQEVDYSTGVIAPANIDQIRNNTATRAEVNEYIHNSAGMVRGKYTGKQLRGQYLNEYTFGDVSYGTTPVVDYTSKYFGYAPSLERTDPLVVGKTQYSLRYLIDDNREVLDMTAVDESRKHTSQNFRQEENVSVRLQNPRITALGAGPNYYLIGDTKVYKSGKRPEYILGTEVTLGEFTTGNIAFEGTSVSDYGFLATNSTNHITSPAGSTLIFDTEISDDNGPSGNGLYSGSNGNFEFHEASEARVSFRVNGTLKNIKTQQAEATINIILERSGTDTILETEVIEVPPTDVGLNPGTEPFFIQSGLRYFEANDKIRVNVAGEVGVSVEAGANFLNIQTPKPSAAVTGSNIWTTGSSSTGYTLTSSAALANQYGTNIQEPLSGSSFPSASLLFTLERGDEFRFNGNEDSTYIVTEVKQEGLVYVTLNRPLNPAINIEHFTVRRFVDDPTALITNQKKLAGDTSPAFILPKYAAPDLNDNLDTIIKDLVGQNLI